MFDITRKWTFDQIPSMYRQIKKKTPIGVDFFLIGNKSDLKYLREVSVGEAQIMMEEYHFKDYLEVSSLNRFNFDKIFGILVKNYKKFLRIHQKKKLI